jgi:hypothetical protein
LHDHAEEYCSSSSSPHGGCISHPAAVIPTPNTANDGFISFSSNSTHALRDTTELLAGAPHDDRRSTFRFLREDGWDPTVGSYSGYHPLPETHFIILGLHQCYLEGVQSWIRAAWHMGLRTLGLFCNLKPTIKLQLRTLRIPFSRVLPKTTNQKHPQIPMHDDHYVCTPPHRSYTPDLTCSCSQSLPTTARPTSITSPYHQSNPWAEASSNPLNIPPAKFLLDVATHQVA